MRTCSSVSVHSFPRKYWARVQIVGLPYMTSNSDKRISILSQTVGIVEYLWWQYQLLLPTYLYKRYNELSSKAIHLLGVLFCFFFCVLRWIVVYYGYESGRPHFRTKYYDMLFDVLFCTLMMGCFLGKIHDQLNIVYEFVSVSGFVRWIQMAFIVKCIHWQFIINLLFLRFCLWNYSVWDP